MDLLISRFSWPYLFVFGLSVFISGLLLIGLGPWGSIFFIFSIFFLLLTFYLFTLPYRSLAKYGNIVSPTDGIITNYKQINGVEYKYLHNTNYTYIEIDSSIFCDYYKYSPVNGVIKDIIFEKSNYKKTRCYEITFCIEDVNQNIITIVVYSTGLGVILGFVEVLVKHGDTVKRGDKLCAALFGSKTQLYISASIDINHEINRFLSVIACSTRIDEI